MRSDLDALAEGLQAAVDGRMGAAQAHVVALDLAATPPVAALLARAALADELAAWVTEHQWGDRDCCGDHECFDCGYLGTHDEGCHTAMLLAKWEASK